MTADRDARLDALIAKDEIRDLMLGYARALDRCDLDAMKALFHPDATFTHADHYDGPAAGFCDHAVPFLRTLGPQQHFICNQIIAVEGDRARSETYGLAVHRCTDPEGRILDNWIGARLLDVFERREGRWKILRRRTIVDWNNDLDTSETWARGAMGPPHMGEEHRGRKDRDDPSYGWFAGRTAADRVAGGQFR